VGRADAEAEDALPFGALSAAVAAFTVPILEVKALDELAPGAVAVTAELEAVGPCTDVIMTAAAAGAGGGLTGGGGLMLAPNTTLMSSSLDVSLIKPGMESRP
jgi:hypothetical protein